MNFLDISISHDRIDAVVKSNTRESLHCILINAYGTLCSCEGFNYRGKCTHVDDLILFLQEKINFQFGEFMSQASSFNMQPEMVKTSLTVFNELFDGLPVGQLFGFYGTHQSGKTMAMNQLTYDSFRYFKKQNALKKRKGQMNALFMDMESGLYEHTLKYWVPVWNKRFNMNVSLENWIVDSRKLKLMSPKDKMQISKGTKTIPIRLVEKAGDSEAEHKIIVLDVIDLEQLFLIHGKPCRIKYGKEDKTKPLEGTGKGKITIIPQPEWAWFKDVAKIPLTRYIEEFDVGTLVYDSLTACVGVEFAANQQAFPGRADANMIILGQAQKVCKYHKTITMISHHATREPGGYKKGVPTGGKPVGHNFKFWSYMLKGTQPKDTDKEGYRRTFEVARHTFKPDGLNGTVKLNNLGFSDLR